MSTCENDSGIGDLVILESWIESIGVTRTTAWRWRQRGLFHVTNVFGRNYVSRTEIANFELRAKSGEFSKTTAIQSQKTLNSAH